MALETLVTAVLFPCLPHVDPCGIWVFFQVRCFVVQQGGGHPSGLGATVFVRGGGDGGEHIRARK